MSAPKLTSLGNVFDATKVAPQQPMEAVPSNWYSVILSDGEVKPTDAGGMRVAVEWTITEGPYAGRKIFDGFNIVNSNPQAQQIAASQFSALCHATGVFQVTDVQQLFNKPHQIKVDVEGERFVDPGTPNAKKYDAKNRVRAIKAGSAPTVATNGTGTPPAWAKSAATGVQTPPAAVATPGAPPWGQTGAVVPPVAAPAQNPPPKRGRPPKNPVAATPPPPTAVAQPTRTFWLGLEGPAGETSYPEQQVLEFILKGMPSTTPCVLDGEQTWKTVADYITPPGASKQVAFTPPTAATVPPPAATNSAAPPWAR